MNYKIIPLIFFVLVSSSIFGGKLELTLDDFVVTPRSIEKGGLGRVKYSIATYVKRGEDAKRDTLLLTVFQRRVLDHTIYFNISRANGELNFFDICYESGESYRILLSSTKGKVRVVVHSDKSEVVCEPFGIPIIKEGVEKIWGSSPDSEIDSDDVGALVFCVLLATTDAKKELMTNKV